MRLLAFQQLTHLFLISVGVVNRRTCCCFSNNFGDRTLEPADLPPTMSPRGDSPQHLPSAFQNSHPPIPQRLADHYLQKAHNRNMSSSSRILDSPQSTPSPANAVRQLDLHQAAFLFPIPYSLPPLPPPLSIAPIMVHIKNNPFIINTIQERSSAQVVNMTSFFAEFSPVSLPKTRSERPLRAPIDHFLNAHIPSRKLTSNSPLTACGLALNLPERRK
jgi:hypothetical protein